MIRIFYKPFGLVASVVGGILAGMLFKRTWRAIAGEDESPSATDRDRRWSEIIIAAALEGALFGAVKAAVDRAGAASFARATGTWPGKTDNPNNS
jgi:hypothetical protein